MQVQVQEDMGLKTSSASLTIESQSIVTMGCRGDVPDTVGGEAFSRVRRYAHLAFNLCICGRKWEQTAGSPGNIPEVASLALLVHPWPQEFSPSFPPTLRRFKAPKITPSLLCLSNRSQRWVSVGSMASLHVAR